GRRHRRPGGAARRRRRVGNQRALPPRSGLDQRGLRRPVAGFRPGGAGALGHPCRTGGPRQRVPRLEERFFHPDSTIPSAPRGVAGDHNPRSTQPMSQYSLFTSESVSEGNPDKMADQISDAVLDAIIARDKRTRVAVETLVKTGMAIVAGEVTTSCYVDLEDIIRDVITGIGYHGSEVGFDGATCAVINAIGKQSLDINQGVDRANPEDQGAGDQGLMFGYATNETEVLMPAPLYYSHRLVERQAYLRKHNVLPWLRPDAKSQLTLRYENGVPVAVEAVVLST